MRYLLDCIRSELQQYFVDNGHDEASFSPERRALAYRCARNIEGFRPFGTVNNVPKVEDEWLNHANHPHHIEDADFRIRIGSDACNKPYESSVLNFSGLSSGALSSNAIEALNRGARMGGFAHSTGEGSIHAHRKLHGGDLILQVGGGFVGCHDDHSNFDPDKFAITAGRDQVKMVEIKLSHDAKLNQATTRNLRKSRDCIGTNSNTVFETPMGLVSFIEQIRTLGHGKPVGIKLCISHPSEFFGIAKAMCEKDIFPDFITIDEHVDKNRGAAIEIVDRIGAPLRDALMLTHNTLVGLGVREQIKIIVAGKFVSTIDLAGAFSLGADGCNMISSSVPAIDAADNEATMAAEQSNFVADDKQHLDVAQFHVNTLKALAEAVGAAGVHHPSELAAHHLMLRSNSREVYSAANQYDWLAPGALLADRHTHPTFQQFWDLPDADNFSRAA